MNAANAAAADAPPSSDGSIDSTGSHSGSELAGERATTSNDHKPIGFQDAGASSMMDGETKASDNTTETATVEEDVAGDSTSTKGGGSSSYETIGLTLMCAVLGAATVVGVGTSATGAPKPCGAKPSQAKLCQLLTPQTASAADSRGRRRRGMSSSMPRDRAHGERDHNPPPRPTTPTPARTHRRTFSWRPNRSKARLRLSNTAPPRSTSSPQVARRRTQTTSAARTTLPRSG